LGKIMYSVKLEMEYCKMVGITPTIDFVQAAKVPKKLAAEK